NIGAGEQEPPRNDMPEQLLFFRIYAYRTSLAQIDLHFIPRAAGWQFERFNRPFLKGIWMN
ncbi:MAG TPA: hypothetical protein PLA27_11940, partial [Anaerolineales bacterium]|nr:hypothetical protein [Anaerolineales bacterium]HQX17127.1 hypothetical protein [Anaerolineales bacterium]